MNRSKVAKVKAGSDSPHSNKNPFSSIDIFSSPYSAILGWIYLIVISFKIVLHRPINKQQVPQLKVVLTDLSRGEEPIVLRSNVLDLFIGICKQWNSIASFTPL